MGDLTEEQAQRAFGREDKKMSEFTQKHAQISFSSKLKEQNGHEF